MEHKSIKEQELELIQELAHLEKEQEKQIDIVLDTRTCLLRDQDAIKAYVAELDPREQSQVKYVNTKKKNLSTHLEHQFLWVARALYLSQGDLQQVHDQDDRLGHTPEI